jgi:hypothetical protein
LQLDDWVLCRIYNKKGVIERYDTVDAAAAAAAAGEVLKPAAAAKNNALAPVMKVELSDYGFYHQEQSPPATEMLCFDRSGSADRDSMPRLHTDSSSSDRVLSSPSPSPSRDFPRDMERDRDYAESQHYHTAGGGGGGCWPGAIDVDDRFVIDGSLFDPLSPSPPGGFFARDAAAFGDMFPYLLKPF